LANLLEHEFDTSYAPREGCPRRDSNPHALTGNGF
jgi:hypothetical protein